MAYTEKRWQGNEYRQTYLDGINELVVKLREKADTERAEYAKDILTEPEKYREEFKKMLGYPLTEKFDENDIPNTQKTFVTNDNGISIYRMQFEILPKLWFYGLYFEHSDGQKRPLVICQHGGAGTCEIVSSFFECHNYNDLVKRVLAYDVNVFAPQLLLWQSTVYGIDYDRRQTDISLKQVGSSITAVEIYGIMKGVNYLLSLGANDSERLGMVGLSYGGFYTLFTAACDTRIKCAMSNCFYNDRFAINWSDWMWDGSGQKFLDNEAALLVYPRFLSVCMGDKDPLFNADKAKAEFEKLMAFCGENTDWASLNVFDGVHEFPPDEQYLKAWMDKFLA